MLCKNINVDMSEVYDLIAKNPDKSCWAKLEQIYNSLDKNNSPDFQGRVCHVPSAVAKRVGCVQGTAPCFSHGGTMHTLHLIVPPSPP